MLDDVKISLRQFTVLAVLITIGDSILVLPAVPALVAKQDAWISGLVGLAAGLVIVYLLCKAWALQPRLTFIESSRIILGKWLGGAVSLLFLGYLFLSAAAHIREIGDFMTTEILTKTPYAAIHILFLYIIVLGSWLGLEAIARTGEIFIPLLVSLFLIPLVAILPLAHGERILPILEEGMKPIIRGSITFTAFPFMELVVFLMVLPYVEQTDKVTKRFLCGAMLGGVVLIVVMVLAIMVLGPELTARHLYPTYALAKKISIGHFFQRVEAILAFFWILTTYFKIAVYFLAFIIGLAQLLTLKEYRALILPMGMILLALASIISPNISYYNEVIASYWPLFDMTYSVLFPLCLVAVAFLRKIRKPLSRPIQ
ncbi:endospore germination permease [Brevibacillus sp. B_LB10_24]|uniref:GerAB/ArcD/ProY family transporter n=1 Tax=Brevibacillus sp. B_LB10_24 TaxID=3380645 RepID=UPI0038BCFFBB